MKRWILLRVVVLLLVTAAALHYAIVSYALTSATVSFQGSYSVGGAGTRFISCSLSKSSMALKTPQQGNQSASDTATLTCVNNLPTAVTLNLSILNGAGTPTGGGNRPTYAWSKTSLTIPGGGSDSATLTVTVAKNTTPVVYTYQFDVSGSTSPLVLDYTKTGWVITITVT